MSTCSHYSIQDCAGVCRGEESPESYNQRVVEAIKHLRESNQNKVLKERGRHEEEDAFVMVRNGVYLGYGFVDRNASIDHEDDLENFLIPQKDNRDVQMILRKVLIGA